MRSNLRRSSQSGQHADVRSQVRFTAKRVQTVLRRERVDGGVDREVDMASG